MCVTQKYLGAKTPFGVIIRIEPYLFNPLATCRSEDGSETVRQLGRLQALGVRPPSSQSGRRYE